MKSSISEYLARFKDHISSLDLNKNASVLIAWSGGLDSTVLVYLMKHYSPCSVYTAYFNHCLRPDEELEKEVIFLKSQAEEWNVQLLTGTAGIGTIESLKRRNHGSLEEWARNERYHFLEKLKKENRIDFLLTAHHRDDEAETLLFRFLQGSSVMGLGGLEGKQPFESTILRPLICFSREELKNIAEEFSLKWSRDSSNDNSEYLRNRIRKELIPAVEAIFPTFRENLHKGAEKNRLYAKTVKRTVENLSINENQGVLSLPESTFNKLAPFERLEFLYSMADRLLKNKIHGYRIPYRFFSDLLEAPLNASIYREGHGLILDRWKGSIRMLLAKKEIAEDIFMPVPINQWIILGEWRFFFSEEKLKETSISLHGHREEWSIRCKKPDDRMLPAGRLKKRLSEFPRDERYLIPLLFYKEQVCAVLRGAKKKIMGDFEKNLQKNKGKLYMIMELNDAV